MVGTLILAGISLCSGTELRPDAGLPETERFGLVELRFGVESLVGVGDLIPLTGEATLEELADLESSLSEAKTGRRRSPNLFIPRRSRRSHSS